MSLPNRRRNILNKLCKPWVLNQLMFIDSPTSFFAMSKKVKYVFVCITGKCLKNTHNFKRENLPLFIQFGSLNSDKLFLTPFLEINYDVTDFLNEDKNLFLAYVTFLSKNSST